MSTIPDYFRSFCDDCLYDRGYSPATIKSMQQCMNAFLSFSGAEDIHDFNRRSISEWIRYGRSIVKWSAKTVHIYLGYLKQFADWAIDQDIISENPTTKIPRPRKIFKLPEFFTNDEKDELMTWVRNYPYYYSEEKSRAIAIFATFICSGIRKKELLNLKLEDVNMQNYSIYVRQGKGGKDRYVSFSPKLIPMLQEWLKDRRRMRIKCPYFFTSIKRDQHLSDCVLARLFDKIEDASGMHIYAHKLRHTFATLSLQQGFTIREVQEMLGHTSLESTMIYLSVCNRQLHTKVMTMGIRA